ncbi:MAG: hypothetical protein J0I17_04605 ['Candidatus Kapabacteria' thiocyanatum]|uniref:Lipoprotein n=1 Tax=Candidatus Kapaibacterium thiocyanatum TaxID=1895771 RepID=A0A1M3L5N7_9BACT|nr:hypothetical protein ['Candidatus Kapabacteria' thiocyanatum]OJX60860.1 MAG: hypothetical protein BGO89_04665 ['Candidatus Kapabacteria' thiocyanatum]
MTTGSIRSILGICIVAPMVLLASCVQPNDVDGDRKYKNTEVTERALDLVTTWEEAMTANMIGVAPIELRFRNTSDLAVRILGVDVTSLSSSYRDLLLQPSIMPDSLGPAGRPNSELVVPVYASSRIDVRMAGARVSVVTSFGKQDFVVTLPSPTDRMSGADVIVERDAFGRVALDKEFTAGVRLRNTSTHPYLTRAMGYWTDSTLKMMTVKPDYPVFPLTLGPEETSMVSHLIVPRVRGIHTLRITFFAEALEPTSNPEPMTRDYIGFIVP